MQKQFSITADEAQQHVAVIFPDVNAEKNYCILERRHIKLLPSKCADIKMCGAGWQWSVFIHPI